MRLEETVNELTKQPVFNPGFDFGASKNALVLDECVFS